MKKRLLAVVLTVVLCVSVLSGCGSKTQNTETDQQSEEDTSTEFLSIFGRYNV